MTPRLVLLGVGGLGCPAALALAEEAAASGTDLQIVLVDPDRVERSNLARQILFREEDAGKLKVEVATRALRDFVPSAPVSVEPRAERFDGRNAADLLAHASVVLDGTDDVQTRFLANDAARAFRVPLVHGAAVGWTGHLLSVVPGEEGGCLRCLFEGPPPPGALPACAEAGVASPLCGLVGAAMAAEAVRLLRGEPLQAASTLLRWDGLSGRVRRLRIARDGDCSACAASPAAASHRKTTRRMACPSP